MLLADIAAHDLPALTSLHLGAFAGYANTRIGAGYVRAFLSWFVSAPDGIAVVARQDRQPVGYVVGAPLGYGRRMNRDLLVPAALGVLSHPRVLIDRRVLGILAARVGVLLGRSGANAGAEPELPEPVVSLVGIGVSPAAQGLGAGRALVERFEELSRERGMRAARLSVYADNAGARRLYEKAGWWPFPTTGRTVIYWKIL